MRNAATFSDTEAPYVARLKALAELMPAEIDALLSAGQRAIRYAVRREIPRGDATLSEPKILIEGWAAQVRDFRDGRRQVLHLMVPGDVILPVQRGGASPTVVALTDILVAGAPAAENQDSGLGLAYSLSADIERACLQRQVARIGRLDAYERLADLFLELGDRLSLADPSALESFALPLTQETLADSLGLTSVHINRTLQQMRREGVIDDHRRTIKLLEPDHLRTLVDYQPLISRDNAPGRNSLIG